MSTENTNNTTSTPGEGQQSRPAGTGAPRPAGTGAPRPAGTGASRPAGPGGHRPGGRPQGGGGRDRRPGGGGRRRFFRKKVCFFCSNKITTCDYKELDLLRRFVTDRGKILPRRITGTCAKHQRMVAREIRKARIVAFLPFEDK